LEVWIGSGRRRAREVEVAPVSDQPGGEEVEVTVREVSVEFRQGSDDDSMVDRVEGFPKVKGDRVEREGEGEGVLVESMEAQSCLGDADRCAESELELVDHRVCRLTTPQRGDAKGEDGVEDATKERKEGDGPVVEG